MIFYPPTTLLPPSPPYKSPSVMITALCDRCLVIADDDSLSQLDIDQYFEIVMAIMDFWFDELGPGNFL